MLFTDLKTGKGASIIVYRHEANVKFPKELKDQPLYFTDHPDKWSINTTYKTKLKLILKNPYVHTSENLYELDQKLEKKVKAAGFDSLIWINTKFSNEDQGILFHPTSQNVKVISSKKEKWSLDLSPGDEILTGKFKNKLATVKDFSTDANNQPVVKTDKGDAGLKFRIKKLMPKKEARFKPYKFEEGKTVLLPFKNDKGTKIPGEYIIVKDGKKIGYVSSYRAMGKKGSGYKISLYSDENQNASNDTVDSLSDVKAWIKVL